jgi:hypothetical protein
LSSCQWRKAKSALHRQINYLTFPRANIPQPKR